MVSAHNYAATRRLSSSPEQMALFAVITGVVSVWFGLQGSLAWDTPAGPSIVVAALCCFVLSVMPLPKALRRRKDRMKDVSPSHEGPR